MNREQVRQFGPLLGVASLMMGVVAFLAALLGVKLSGPGQRLDVLEPTVVQMRMTVDTLARRVELVEGSVTADCLDPETRLRLVQARVPCFQLLRKAGLE